MRGKERLRQLVSKGGRGYTLDPALRGEQADDVGLRRVAEAEGKMKLRIAVPHQFCGALLGKGGARIKEMSTASGAWLRLSEDTRSGHSGSERVLYLAGKVFFSSPRGRGGGWGDLVA